MGRSPGFGSTARYQGRPVRTRFRYGCASWAGLTEQRTVTRRFILQKARRHPIPKDIGLRLLVGNRFQVLFHSPPGVLFTFPSRYRFTPGRNAPLPEEQSPAPLPRFGT